ncbi:MAG: DUF4175 family protein, partial [Armatimonadetes bacterium]|nr:DUF4175 family protein [Armatimonadota bacterium]
PSPTSPVPAPTLTQFSLVIEPPAYTGLAAQTLAQPAAAQVPEGSTVRLEAQFADATDVEVQWGQQKEKAGPEVRASHSVSQPLQWAMVAQGRGGKLKLGPFAVGVIADRKPQVSFVQPRGEVVLDSPRQVPLQVLAEDDYGIARVSLRWRQGAKGAWQQITLAHDCGRRYEGGVGFDLRPMKLLPGAEVIVQAVAEDNKTPGGPQRGFSAPVRLRIAVAKAQAQQRPAEAVEQAAAREEDAWERLRRNMNQLGEQIEQLQHQVETGRSHDSAQQRAELADMAQRLEKTASDVKQAMAEAEQRLSLQDVVDEEMLEKVAELHKLAQEVLDEQMKELLDRLREAMKSGELSKLEADARKLKELHDRLMRKLDQTLELLKRAKMEMMLRALERKVKQLVKQQESVSEKTRGLKEGAPESAGEARRQEELARQTGPLPDDVQLAAEQSQKLDPKTADALEALAARLRQEDPAGKMRQAAQALRRGAPADAGPPQDQALNALRQAAADLAGMQADMTGRQRRQLQAAASRVVAEAVGLAQAQQRLAQQTRPLGREFLGRAVQQKETLERLSANQKALADGAAKLAQQLQQLAGKTPLAGPELAARMAGVGERMRQAARSLQGGEGGMAETLQRLSVEELNQLAADLAVLSQALGQQSAQMALSEYLKRLEQLAEQQRGLNDRSQQLGNGNPRLSELGAQQAMLRAALDKLMRGAGKQLSDKLGGVGQDMEAVAKDLKGRRLTAKTKTRQRDLLHKMLDAQRSLYTRHQQSRERKAERPRAWQPAPSPPAVAVEGPPRLKLPEIEPSQIDEVPPEYEDLAQEYLRKVRPH